MTTLLDDVRYAVRALAKRPGFAVAVVACIIPASRAARIDPAEALRSE